MPETWSAAERLLDSGRAHRDMMKLGHNTRLVRRRSDILDIIYHQTAIVRLTPDGAILDNGGWYTRTTANRVRTFLQARGMNLFVHKKQWFVVDGSDVEHAWRNGMRISGSDVVADGE